MRNNPGKDASQTSPAPAEGLKPEVNFHSIWLNFTLNMWALWEFCEKFSQTADEYDKDKFDDTAREIARITGKDIAFVEQIYRSYLENLPKAEYALDENGERDPQEIAGLIHSGELESIFLNLKRRNREKYNEFQKWYYRFIENPPTTGPTLRQSSLLLLVSCFDFLIDTLAVTYNNAKPVIPAHTPIGIKRGKSYLTELKNRVGCINALAEFEPDRMEINARRNMFAHRDGVIDEDYFTQSGRESNPLLFKKRALVSVNYINNAIETIFVYGAILTQCCWLTWFPDQKEEADKVFNRLLYTALIHKKYNLVIQLVETRKKIEEFPDIPKVALVNQAVAYRELGNKDKVTTIIEELEQGKPDQLIILAIAVLKENKIEIQRKLTEFNRQNYGNMLEIDWPLFNPIRRYAWFTKPFRARGSLPKSK